MEIPFACGLLRFLRDRREPKSQRGRCRGPSSSLRRHYEVAIHSANDLVPAGTDGFLEAFPRARSGTLPVASRACFNVAPAACRMFRAETPTVAVRGLIFLIAAPPDAISPVEIGPV